MQLHRVDNVQEFWQRAQDYLMRYEAEHNAILGIMQTLLHYPERYPEPPYLALVEREDQVLAIAIRTPPNNLLLSEVQDLNALDLIAQDLRQVPLPGVNGSVAEVERFVQIWQSLTGQSYQRERDSRIYQLTQVEPMIAAKGQLRLATVGDRPLLVEWLTEFESQIDMTTVDGIERRVAVELKRQSLYLWDDDGPVSMVGGRQFSPTAARIAPVYTPLEHRCKGYATAAVAALSQKFLKEGCDRCFLFTDLANPTSNSIYQKIGYRPVCDWHEYTFG